MPITKDMQGRDVGAERPSAKSPARTVGADPDGVMDLVVALAVSAMPSATAASVSLIPDRLSGPRTIAASSRLATALDAAQFASRCGPGIETMTTGLEIRATLPDVRWPHLSSRAEAMRTRAVWSLPLSRSGSPAGALTVYSTNGEPWIDGRAAGSRLVAELAELELRTAAATAELARGNATLQEALETRTIIGQAQGMLMVRERISADQAFDILRRASQRTNRKLRDIAGELVARATEPPTERSDP